MADHADIDHTGLTGVPGSNPQFTTIELGHASDTTLARVSAGVVSIEGTNIVKAGAATGSGLTMATARLLGRTTASAGAIEEITVGSGLSLSAGSLTASGSSAPIASGTSNPGGPSTNDLFFRTDLDLIIQYDGTQWRCICPHRADFGSIEAAAGTTDRRISWYPGGLDIWVIRIPLVTYVNGTSNGSNYHTVTIRKYTAANAFTTIHSAVTSGDTTNTHTDHTETASSEVIDVSTHFGVSCLTQVTAGAPGPLYSQASIEYNFIVT